MAATTGPILAAGAVTLVNRTVFNQQPMDWRVPIATGLAAVGFELAERVWPAGAVVLSWTTFLSALLVSTDGHPSAMQNALNWWNGGK